MLSAPGLHVARARKEVLAVGRIDPRVAFAILSVWVAGCTFPRADQQSQGGRSKQSLTEPVMVSQIVTLRGEATLTHVRGKCDLIRDEIGSQAVQAGQTLRDGDVLDLNDSCSLEVLSSGRTMKLSRENGRFFRFRIE